MKDRVPICGGFICIVGDPRILIFDGAKWIFYRETYRELVTRCSDKGMRLIRKMLWSPFGCTGSIKNMFQPYAMSGEQFDLGHENDFYWPIMEEMRDIDRSVNVTGRYDIADGCELLPGNWHKYVPWMNNVQGIKTLYQKEAYPIYEALAREAVKRLGADQYYSGGNEMENAGFIEVFTRVIVKLIQEGIFKPEQFAYGPVMPDANFVAVPVQEGDILTHYPSPVKEGTLGQCKRLAEDLLGATVKKLIYRDVHAVGSPPYDDIREFGPREHQMKELWGKYPIKAQASTDGKKLSPSDPRASKCDVDVDGARISGETWYAMAVDLMKAYPSEKGQLKQCLILEHCPQTMNIDCLVKTFESISKAVYDVKGVWPENYGKHPYIPPAPPPPPEPPTVLVEVCKDSQLLPNELCPEKEVKTFLKGEEPTAVCGVHKAPEKPCSYFLKRLNILGWLRCVFLGKH